MRHFIAIAVAALAIGSAAPAAWANDALNKSGQPATTEPRGAVAGTQDLMAYDVDLSNVHMAPVISRG